jgi:hypothetical protein
MTLVAVITVLSRRLDVAFALAAKLPRLALNGFLPFFWSHISSPLCAHCAALLAKKNASALVSRLDRMYK